MNEKGKSILTTPYEPFSFKRLRRYNFISHPATFVSRQLFGQVGGFNPDLKYCMDYDLWLRLALIEPAFAMNVVCARFRQHSQSLSTSAPQHVADEAYYVRNQYTQSYYERLRSYLTWRKRKKSLDHV